MAFLNLTYEIWHQGEAVCGGKITSARELLALIRKYRKRKIVLQIGAAEGDGAWVEMSSVTNGF